MDSEEKKLLEDTFRLTEENNRLLRKVRGVQKRAAILSLLYWVLIIGVSIGAFYFLQPYVNQVQGFYKATSTNFDNLKNSISK